MSGWVDRSFSTQSMSNPTLQQRRHEWPPEATTTEHENDSCLPYEVELLLIVPGPGRPSVSRRTVHGVFERPVSNRQRPCVAIVPRCDSIVPWQCPTHRLRPRHSKCETCRVRPCVDWHWASRQRGHDETKWWTTRFFPFQSLFRQQGRNIGMDQHACHGQNVRNDHFG